MAILRKSQNSLLHDEQNSDFLFLFLMLADKTRSQVEYMYAATLVNFIPDKWCTARVISAPLNVDGAFVQQSYDGRCNACESE